MAFIGWTGKGVLKYTPQMTIDAPKENKTPKGAILSTAMYATTNGISVPRSPKAPAHSMRPKRLPWTSAVSEPSGISGTLRARSVN